MQFASFLRLGRQYRHVAVDSSDLSSIDEESSQDGLLEKTSSSEALNFVQKRPSFLRRHAFILSHVVSLTLFSVMFYLFSAIPGRPSCLSGPGLVNSPARAAVQYTEKTFVGGDKIQEQSPFSGRPSPEVDAAWHELLRIENFRLDHSVVARLGREAKSVAMPDGSGYIGTLNVYHELHCIKRLHQSLYPETYFQGASAEEMEMHRLHNEHCLDFLRQSSMCHGDIGLITFFWDDHSLIPIANGTTHECINWEMLSEWVEDRYVDMMKPGWLVHPKLGLAYPEGKGDKVGAVNLGDDHDGHHPI